LIEYRIESFCILLVNSWELLLKARIVETRGKEEIYKSDGKTISLWKCLVILFPDREDPMRKNIESIIELRDKAVHLLIPDIQATLSRIFQANIFNYIKIVKRYNYPNPYINQNPGLMTFITDAEDLDYRTITEKYGEVTIEEIKRFKQKIKDEEGKLNNEDFVIPIGYKIVLTKNENEGDLKISTSPDGESAMFIKVPKDNNVTHPYRSSDVINLVNEHFKKEIINQYSLQGILLKEKIRINKSNTYYFFIENPETHKYSNEFVELIIHKTESHPDYIEKCRKMYSDHRRKIRSGI